MYQYLSCILLRSVFLSTPLNPLFYFVVWATFPIAVYIGNHNKSQSNLWIFFAFNLFYFCLNCVLFGCCEGILSVQSEKLRLTGHVVILLFLPIIWRTLLFQNSNKFQRFLCYKLLEICTQYMNELNSLLRGKILPLNLLFKICPIDYYKRQFVCLHQLII